MVSYSDVMNKSNKKLKEVVKQKYAEIAKSEQSGGCGCCGSDKNDCDPNKNVAFSDDYSDQKGYLKEADLGLGCGIPTDIAQIKPGQTVIDLGSGAGNDCFVASRVVGDDGLVIGVDMTREMIDRAKKNASLAGITNVKFRLGDIEDLPISSNKADVVISNCVINLVPDKFAAFNEIIRVLKPGGHFAVSDIVIEGEVPDLLREKAEFYVGCISGAVSLKEYLSIIDQTGFQKVGVLKRKRIELPVSFVQDILNQNEYILYLEAGIGIYSVTIYGEKPSSCCG